MVNGPVELLIIRRFLSKPSSKKNFSISNQNVLFLKFQRSRNVPMLLLWHFSRSHKSLKQSHKYKDKSWMQRKTLIQLSYFSYNLVSDVEGTSSHDFRQSSSLYQTYFFQIEFYATVRLSEVTAVLQISLVINKFSENQRFHEANLFCGNWNDHLFDRARTSPLNSSKLTILSRTFNGLCGLLPVAL